MTRRGAPQRPRLAGDTGERAAVFRGGRGAAVGVLAPGGVLAVWSASRSSTLAGRMAEVRTDVETLDMPVGRGDPDVVLLGTVS